jgi:hypothetical protein
MIDALDVGRHWEGKGPKPRNDASALSLLAGRFSEQAA